MKCARVALMPAMIGVLMTGCVSDSDHESTLSLFATQSLAAREMESRRFDTPDEKKILVACAALLQDLGFIIDDSCTELGVIVASKDSNASDRHLTAGTVAVAALLGIVAKPDEQPEQFRACVVTRPAENTKAIIVRVNFQRIVWDQHHHLSEAEEINNPASYQEFFQKLSKAVFLQANQL